MFFNSFLLLGTISLLWWRSNIISILISLELILLSCFVAISWNFPSFNIFTTLLFLSLIVSGSALGLSLLVLLSRSYSPSTLIINLL